MDHSIRLTVSDLRPSIIANLRKRFENAGLRKYYALVADLIQPSTLPFPREYFDIIICDAPCTGSGTWSRTPEQLFYFDENRIANYALMQQAIVSRVIPYLKPGGSLLYATCSVFRQENELIVDHMVRDHQLRVNRMELLKGYDMKADTMFVTLLSRES
jgi:16S rRNA (cytosine967-C5)-methyltransferase